MLGFMPMFILLQLIHWFSFFLDALFFPGYRQVKVRRPMFVIGPPRSGTTHLHRVLADDREQFTTFSTWELFLAPNIIQKKLIRLITVIDRKLGKPLFRLISFLERHVLQVADAMHPSALQAPEEDYFLMCMTLTCSGLALVFPRSGRFWRYAFFDSTISAATKQRAMTFYRICLQKHLYTAGADKILLSKNASFNPWLESLYHEFPDASFIVCARDPVKTVPSMLSVANAARVSFGGSTSNSEFEKNMIALMKHHYQTLLNILPKIPAERMMVVPNKRLHLQLRSTILDAYQHFGLSVNKLFSEKLNELDRESRRFKSAHQYTPSRFGLSTEKIKNEFRFAYALLDDYIPQTISNIERPFPQRDYSSFMTSDTTPEKDEIETTSPTLSSDRRSISKIRCNTLILSDSIPERNGVGTYYRDLVDYLSDFVKKVDMIPASANCYFKQRNVSLRMPGDYTQRIHFPNMIRIIRRMRDMKPDVIVAPTLGPFGFFAYLLSRYYKTRFIVGHHTAYHKLTQLYWKGARAYISSSFMERMSRFLMQSADAVVANSSEMTSEAKQNGAKQAHCVGTTISKPYFQRRVLPFSGKVKTVLYAGRLAAEKNVWSLLEAAKEFPEQTFLIAGEGPERKALQAEAKTLPNVKLLGWLPRSRLLTQIDESDIIVLPSFIESFGTAALEGMARGRLVIVSHHCGILEWPELVEGLYIINENENLTAALKRINQEDISARKKKALAAYHLTRTMNDRTLAHWLDILKDNGNTNA